jgi:hypothetical protein
MQIRAADAAGTDLDSNLARPGIPIGKCRPLERGSDLVEHHRLHVVLLVNAASVSLMASTSPDCICSLAPSLTSLAATEGTSATCRSWGWVSFSTAILIYMKCFSIAASAMPEHR